MARTLRTIALTILVAAVAAGCFANNAQQSTISPGDNSSRDFSFSLPAGATQVRVDTVAQTTADSPDVTVLVKDWSGNILGTHTWAVKDRASDSLIVDVSGQATLTVVAKVLDGDATLDVRVTAIVPNAPEVVVVERTLVITQAPAPTTPASPGSNTTASPSPTPMPTNSTSSPTASNTSSTNTTNTSATNESSTNTSANGNSTNSSNTTG